MVVVCGGGGGVWWCGHDTIQGMWTSRQSARPGICAQQASILHESQSMRYVGKDALRACKKRSSTTICSSLHVHQSGPLQDAIADAAAAAAALIMLPTPLLSTRYRSLQSIITWPVPVW